MLPNINKNKYLKKVEPFMDVRVFGLMVFAVIMLLVSWSGLKVLQTNYELEKRITQLNQRNQIQDLQNQNLKLKNQYFETDQYLELTARRQFSKAAPGEKLYLVPDSVAMAKTIDVPKEAVQVKASEKPLPKYRENLNAWMAFLMHRQQ